MLNSTAPVILRKSEYDDIISDISDLTSDISDLTTDISNLETDVSELQTALGNKQDTLISGVNIKTINGISVLGSGDISTLMANAYVEVSVDYTVLSTDYTVNVKSPVTITLPTAVGITGKIFNIKNTSSGIVTILTTGSELIDDDLFVKSWVRNSNIPVQSTGTGWIIL